MLTLTQFVSTTNDVKDVKVDFTLFLNAEERTRSRYRFQTEDGQVFWLRLPRGTVFQDGDQLISLTGEVVQILAKPEPVLTITAKSPLDLLRAAYHLGNRHVPLEITSTYLRFSPDSVLEAMLLQLGLEVKKEVVPFHPEIGAYSHSH
ncbi:urease accessory protein UreE [Oscillatoria salina]|uniref:urease accessory protein UreE n=1 Tax=Oscillatoria salina TaxID=331517 RepID=UPI0013BB1EF0|nr:urease accessory protein UreE [Oscillatoria salina]MBZ8179969.1 urease accessory protein UreE [Oscillatoria salina IIICB1]NET86806.1 urease accessory protein UreE [Kamptonema sp. SIO1D9]